MQKGYRRTTSQDLLDATGLSKSSLCPVFGSKQGLFVRAIDRYVSSQEQALRAHLEEGDPKSGLRRMYEGIIQMSVGEGGGRSRTCMMCSASLDVDPTERELVQQFAIARRRVEKVLLTRMVRAQQEGDLLPRVAVTCFSCWQEVSTTEPGTPSMRWGKPSSASRYRGSWISEAIMSEQDAQHQGTRARSHSPASIYRRESGPPSGASPVAAGPNQVRGTAGEPSKTISLKPFTSVVHLCHQMPRKAGG